MSWVLLDDAWADHPKFGSLTALGGQLFVAGITYCNRNMIDGTLTVRQAHRLAWVEGLYVKGDSGGLRAAEATDAVAELLGAGLWHQPGDACENAGEDRPCPTPPAGGYSIHDYLAYQPSVVQRRQTQADKSRAGRLGAAKRWGTNGAGVAPPMADTMAGAIAPPIAERWQNDAPSPSPRTTLSPRSSAPAAEPVPGTEREPTPDQRRVLRARGARAPVAVWNAADEDERNEIRHLALGLTATVTTCKTHFMPEPCSGCAADRKASR